MAADAPVTTKRPGDSLYGPYADWEEYHTKKDKLAAGATLFFASVGLLFLCVGVGTPNWYVTYVSGSGYLIASSVNFYYACTNSTNCASNPYWVGLGYPYTGYPNTSPLISGVPSTDHFTHLQNAAGLAIVGLLFLAFGTIAAVVLAIRPKIYGAGFNGLACAVLFCIAALFERAALSEGQRQMVFNGYGANLYQTGHAFTIAAVPLSAYVAARLHNKA